MKQQLKFLDQTQPQTLVIAVLISYIDAAISVIGFLLGGLNLFSLIALGIACLGAACGIGIANEKRVAYFGAVAIAALYLAWTVFLVFIVGMGFLNGLLGLMFAVAFLILLIHPMSREYTKIWFR